MANPYSIDLEQISLDRFREMLEAKTLLPSRRMLQEDLTERFRSLEALGIHNMQALCDSLKTKRQVEQMAARSGLSPEYLALLRREANSYIARPVNLDEIPNLKPENLERLASAGIKHTRHLYERAGTKVERTALAEQAGIPAEELLEMLRLADLARIVGVGGVFARWLYEVGIHSAAEFARQTPEALLERVQAGNRERQYAEVKLTVKDLEYCLETARLLPQTIEYD